MNRLPYLNSSPTPLDLVNLDSSMRLRVSEIKGLPVFTKSGDRLGSVADVAVDSETHVAVQYVVTRSRLLPAISVNELLVGRAQVVSLDRDRMIVDDAVASEAAAAKMAAAEGTAQAGTSIMEG